MAMIKCKECGKEISSTAEKCPHCGYKTAHGQNVSGAKMLLVFWAITIVCMVVGVILLLVNMGEFMDLKDYLDEFNAIWEKQREYHPELTEELKHEIRDVVIFYQRRLKSQKGLVSFCELESEEREIVTSDGKVRKITVGSKVIPRSSPLFQEFKIWQILNNIEAHKRLIRSAIWYGFLPDAA